MELGLLAVLLLGIGGAILGSLAFVLALKLCQRRHMRRQHRGTQREGRRSRPSARVTPAPPQLAARGGGGPSRKYMHRRGTCRQLTLEHCRRWIHSFVKIDSRTQLANFFYPGDAFGARASREAIIVRKRFECNTE